MEAELLADWERARKLAARWCAGSLARLRAGQGGFYGEEDLWQDLFLEFWQVWQGWRLTGGAADDADASDDALWAAWSRRLWGGGRRVLRRAPQRLWARAEAALPPARLELEPATTADAAAGAAAAVAGEPLPAAARAALIQPDVAPDLAAAHERLAALRAAWVRLPPVPRQSLYLARVVGLPGEAVAQRLGLANAAVAREALRRARRTLSRL